MIIETHEFIQLFNKKIFENSKFDLLKKISENPDRFVGIFRPTKPKIKIIQNLTQSHEIKFGEAMEKIIEVYFHRRGYKILDKRMICENCEYNIDQYLVKGNSIIFIEQKVRDDHDSTKKRGQIANFENKLEQIIKRNPTKNITAFFYFIDPSLCKNKNYYAKEIKTIEETYGVKCILCYGSELFDQLNENIIWEELVNNLLEWRLKLPEFPEMNFDINAEKSFEELKDLPTGCWRKLFENDNIITEVFSVLFPQNKTLRLLKDYWEGNSNLKVYKNLCSKLDNILEVNKS